MAAGAATQSRAGGEVPPASIRVWDPLVRLFHWSLVGFFFFAFFTGDEWKSAHETAGYIVAGLIGFRILWGLVGSRHARFASFVRGPSAVAGYIGDTMKMKARRHVGHNPAGGAMVLALIAAIAVIAATGYMMETDAYWGVEWVEDVHKAVVYATLGLVALHVAGVVLASFEHRENLVRAMITGRKRAPTREDVV
jgi:cytochrome b